MFTQSLLEQTFLNETSSMHLCFVWFIEQKDKLSEVEHQLKRAEAAQRRRIQAAKAAKESEVCLLL